MPLLPERILFCVDVSIEGRTLMARGKTDDLGLVFSIQDDLNLKPPLKQPAASIQTGCIKNVNQPIRESQVQDQFGQARDSPSWICPFTSDTDRVISSTRSLIQTETDDQWNADLMFNELIGQTPDVENPSFVLRVILLYFRSTPITFSESKVLEFTKHPACFIDTIYLHDKASEHKDRVQRVFEQLDELNGSRKNYYLLETHNYKKFVSFFPRFLAHPDQRIVDGGFTLDAPEEGVDRMDVE
ncbi:hypothetical protein BDR26DRAFT_1010995 [Obelidium mucronatum]|nr:hypothetical protein BDR26DRAFT_1010995 [Obelidium mucronatum]